MLEYHPAVEAISNVCSGRRHAVVEVRIACMGEDRGYQLINIQAYLVHSSITIIMDRCTHSFPSDVDELVGRLDDIGTPAGITQVDARRFARASNAAAPLGTQACSNRSESSNPHTANTTAFRSDGGEGVRQATAGRYDRR